MSNRRGCSRCCFASCGASSLKCRGLSFHQLPAAGVSTEQDEWRATLIHLANRKDKLFNPNTAKICSRHFTPDCFVSFGEGTVRHLKKGAIPTQWLEQSSTSTPKLPLRQTKKSRHNVGKQSSVRMSTTEQQEHQNEVEEMRSNKTLEETKDWSDKDAVHSQISSLNKMTRCELCGADFVRATSLVVHMSVYHGQDLQTLPSPDSSLNSNTGSGMIVYNSKQTDDNLRNLSNPESEKAFTCSGCEKTFSHFVVLKPHQDSPKGENMFKCIDCKKAFDLISSNLEGHRSMHSDKTLYMSTDFEKDEIHLNIMNKHHLLIGVNKSFKFTDYSNTYAHEHLLKNLEGIHSGEKPFKCVDCGEAYSQLSSLQEHYITHAVDNKPLNCTYCNKAFSNKNGLIAHLNRYTGGQPCRCSECGKAFHVQIALKKHQRIHRGAYNLYKCIDCGMVFEYPHQLRKHQAIHKADQLYKCPDCNKAFSRPESLKAHQHIHTGDKPYKCTDCGKAFNWLQSFKAHQRLHTGDRPYKCKNCGKAFCLLGSLKEHQHIHAGVKPFSCTYCGKTFRKRQNLNDHLRIHTGDKPYKCTDCDKAFNQRGHLNVHQRRHRDCRCAECGKGFSDKKQLKNPPCIHKGYDPNMCTQYGKTFSKPSNLKRYKKIHAHI